MDLVSSILLRGTIRRDVLLSEVLMEGAVTQNNLYPVARIGLVHTLAGRAEVLGRVGLVLSSSEFSQSETGEVAVVHRHLLLRSCGAMPRVWGEV